MIADIDRRAYNAAFDLQERALAVRRYIAYFAATVGASPELEHEVKAAATKAVVEDGESAWRAIRGGIEDLERACKAARWWGIGA